MRDKVFNAVFVVLIVAVGLIAAYVLFAVLDSQASGEFQGYSVTGAIAGFVVVELLLFNAYQQLRKSDAEDMQERIEELQQKLIRGAPRPKSFETEVAERERLVLARPQEWKPGAGIIFDFQLPRKEPQNDYDLTPEFRCSYAPIEEGANLTKSKIFWWKNGSDGSKTSDYGMHFYENYQRDRLEKGKRNLLYESYSCEHVYLGGETESIESLKVVTREYAEIAPRDTDPATKAKQPPRWWKVTKQRYEELPKNTIETSKSSGTLIPRRSNTKVGKSLSSALAIKPDGRSNPVPDGGHDELISRSQIDSTDLVPDNRPTYGTMVVHTLIICYHEQLKKVYYFDFWDTPGNFVRTSAKFNQILSSVRFLS